MLLSELHSYKAPRAGAELVQDALEHPIGTPRLCDMAVGKKRWLLFLLTIQDLFKPYHDASDLS